VSKIVKCSQCPFLRPECEQYSRCYIDLLPVFTRELNIECMCSFIDSDYRLTEQGIETLDREGRDIPESYYSFHNLNKLLKKKYKIYSIKDGAS